MFIKSCIPFFYIHQPLEILSNGEYSVYSDIFAFGVLIWEIASRSSKPFEGLEWFEIGTEIKRNNRPTIPNDCPIEIKNLIERCWNQDPKQRPPIEQIIEYLENVQLQQTENEGTQYAGNSFSSKYFL